MTTTTDANTKHLIPVKIGWSWNALHRGTGGMSLLGHVIEQNDAPPIYAECCLGIAVRQACFIPEGHTLAGLGMPNQLKDRENLVTYHDTWLNVTPINPILSKTPPVWLDPEKHESTLHYDGHGYEGDYDPRNILESAIADLNDKPYLYANTPRKALDQLVYLFYLMGLDLQIPDEIRQGYIEHWVPVFDQYQARRALARKPPMP